MTEELNFGSVRREGVPLRNRTSVATSLLRWGVFLIGMLCALPAAARDSGEGASEPTEAELHRVSPLEPSPELPEARPFTPEDASEPEPSPPAAEPCAPDDGDFDRDGICDRVERETGTSPLRADTDGDSVPDGQEDKNRDGVVDPGESDPRSAGLFPGSAPHIPEPMVFDLVRGLGAARGELEVNTLVVTKFPRGEAPFVLWAPEIEWAVFDGFAIEFELPMYNRELHALKSAVQYTLPSPGHDFAHGVQWIGEVFLDEPGGSSSLLYLAGGRLGRWSLFSMFGGRVTSRDQVSSLTELLINPSVYYDVAEDLTLGVETNLATSGDRAELRVVPQFHYQIARRLRVQLGGGFIAYEREIDPLIATRIIIE